MHHKNYNPVSTTLECTGRAVGATRNVYILLIQSSTPTSGQSQYIGLKNVVRFMTIEYNIDAFKMSDMQKDRSPYITRYTDFLLLSFAEFTAFS